MRSKIKVSGISEEDRNSKINKLKVLTGEFCALNVRVCDFGTGINRASCLDISFTRDEDYKLFEKVIRGSNLMNSGVSFYV